MESSHTAAILVFPFAGRRWGQVEGWQSLAEILDGLRVLRETPLRSTQESEHGGDDGYQFPAVLHPLRPTGAGSASGREAPDCSGELGVGRDKRRREELW